MFEKRKPIYAGVTYIFDALNESNMAASTSVVTTIKKSKKRKHWIVLSVNNGDIFECHENLLTEFVNYDTVNPIIRCQYGETDFTQMDVAFLDIIVEALAMMDDQIDNPKFKELNTKIKSYMDSFRSKVKKYADISSYKYTIEAMSNINDSIEKAVEHKVSETLSRLMSPLKQNDSEINNFEETVSESKFYNKFDNEVKEYLYSDESMEDFIDKALDILEEDFPEKAMIPNDKKYKYITPGDIDNLKRAASKQIHSNNMVFLVGITSNGVQIAVCVYDMSDFDEVDKFIDTVYDKWSDRGVNYYTEHRIVMLSVPIRQDFNGDDNYE